MKRGAIILSILFVCVCAKAHTRLSPDTKNFFYTHVDAGYSALLHNIANQPSSSGLNTNIGFGYRLYHNTFLFDIGLEGMYQMNANKLEDLDMALPMIDTEGDLFQMHVLVGKSSDLAHMVNLNIPLLMGGEWGRFYFLLGPKMSINLYGVTSSSAQYTTYGEYERYYDDFWDMPNHQFERNKTMSSGAIRMNWNFNILAHAEIGGRVGHYYKYKIFRNVKETTRMYLAAYVDFGILNIHNNAQGKPIFEYRETPDKGLQFYIQPLLTSSLADNAVVRNLNVGIKYTIAFEIQPAAKSYIYDWHEVSTDYRKRGGTQVVK